MRWGRRLMVVALFIMAIGWAARPQSHESVVGRGDAAAVNLHTAVPVPVMATLRRACLDCHSDATRWPWYAAVPVVSHFIARDVAAGRRQLDLSRWTEYNPFARADLLDHMCDMASRGDMPPFQYRVVHRDARLSAPDVAALCTWSRDEAARLVEEKR